MSNNAAKQKLAQWLCINASPPHLCKVMECISLMKQRQQTRLAMQSSQTFLPAFICVCTGPFAISAGCMYTLFCLLTSFALWCRFGDETLCEKRKATRQECSGGGVTGWPYHIHNQESGAKPAVPPHVLQEVQGTLLRRFLLDVCTPTRVSIL